MGHAIATAHHDADERDILGFWLYILTDCILFSCLFATYAVLYQSTYDGTALNTLVSLPYALVETLVLLGSSFTYGMAILALNRSKKTQALLWLGVTLALGYVFMNMEIKEFIELCQEGYSWQRSASLTAFFSLVGTHGLHVTIGLIWMVVAMLQLGTLGITSGVKRRLTYLGLFWAFLDIIWIFVFTIVYLMGAI